MIDKGSLTLRYMKDGVWYQATGYDHIMQIMKDAA
jgi:hypothetical protein